MQLSRLIQFREKATEQSPREKGPNHYPLSWK